MKNELAEVPNETILSAKDVIRRGGQWRDDERNGDMMNGGFN